MHGGNLHVVRDDVGLGESGLGIENLVEVRHAQVPALDLDGAALFRAQDDLLRALIGAKATPGGLAQPAGTGPLAEAHLADEVGLDPGHPVGLGARDGCRERRLVSLAIPAMAAAAGRSAALKPVPTRPT